MPYFESTFGVLSPTMRGFTVSSIMLMAALPSVFTGQLADHYGHLRVVMVGSLVFAVGAILEAASSELSMFLVGRALCGTGEGLWLANVSVFVFVSLLSLKKYLYRKHHIVTSQKLPRVRREEFWSQYLSSW